ncbi:MAG: hypothetical protein AAF529_19910 [Pseudomonadota bacterium]
MKIDLFVNANTQAQDALLAAGVCQAEDFAGIFELDAASEQFAALIEVTTGMEAGWLNPVVSFSKKEIAGALFLRVRCRKTVACSRLDDDRNLEHIEQQPWIDAGAAHGKIRVGSAVVLSKVGSVKPNSVAGVGEWMNEFVVGQAVEQAWSEAGFSGFSMHAVRHSKTDQVFTEIKQLQVDSFMPPMHFDHSMRLHADSPAPRPLGGLVYAEALSPTTLQDFNRTAEAFTGQSMPDFVVSQAVAAQFAEKKFRGWAFEPVLEVGTDLYDEHSEQWAKLNSLVESTQAFFF